MNEFYMVENANEQIYCGYDTKGNIYKIEERKRISETRQIVINYRNRDRNGNFYTTVHEYECTKEILDEIFKTKEQKKQAGKIKHENFRKSISGAYWRSAKEAKTKEQLTNLLKNHERLYCLPSSQDFGNITKKERLDIIFFIRQRLREFE